GGGPPWARGRVPGGAAKDVRAWVPGGVPAGGRGSLGGGRRKPGGRDGAGSAPASGRNSEPVTVTRTPAHTSAGATAPTVGVAPEHAARSTAGARRMSPSYSTALFDEAHDSLGLALDLDVVAELLEDLPRRGQPDDLEVRRGDVLAVDVDVGDAQQPIEERLAVAHVADAPQLHHLDPLGEHAGLALHAAIGHAHAVGLAHEARDEE